MDKSNKRRGPKAPTRKKRLQLDVGTSSLSTVSNSQEYTSTNAPNERAETREPSSSHPTESAEQAASAPTEATLSEARPKSTSPEPNCAICLGKLENKSFTDSCFHMFCFVCLEEWSKVKAECPLCKQTFKSIIHNVRSLDDYDQHHVQQSHQRPEHQVFGDMLDGRRFRYRTTVTDHRYAFAHLWENERHRQMLQRPSRYNPVPNWRRLRQPANSEFRRSIYRQKLKVKQDQVNTRRRVRETSPSFFRENPAQTHRLVPWLNRELNALLDGHGSQVAFVLDLIMGLIKRYEISSNEFYEHVYPYFGRHTRQFMEEFLNFARSPHQMASYDRAIEYEPQATATNHDSESDSDTNRNRDDEDGNDSDVVIVSPPARTSTHCPNAPERSSLDPWERTILGFPPMVRSQGFGDLTNIFLQFPMRSAEQVTALSGWDSPTPSSSHFPFTDNLLNIDGASSHRFDFGTSGSSTIHDVADIPLPSSSAPPIVSNSQADPITCHESDTESNGSDIMIVDYEKPWVERSPIKLSSAEESDFEVMITGMSYPNDPIKKERKKKKTSKSHEEVPERVEKRKRSAEEKSSTDRHKKKKKRKSRSRSRSRSIPKSYRPVKSVVNTVSSGSISSRSRSRSPLRMKLPNYSNYIHKKYNYHHAPTSTKPYYRSRLHRSTSCSSSDTNSDAESHVSIRSRKEKSRSGHSSIEIVEYRKRKSKFKSSRKGSKSGSYDKEKQKHKKDKHDRKHKKSKKSKHKKEKHKRRDSTSRRKKETRIEKGSEENSEHNSSSEEIDITTVRDDSDETTPRQDKLRGIVIDDGTSDSDDDSETDDAFIDVGGTRYMTDGTEKRQNADNHLKAINAIPPSELYKTYHPKASRTSTLELVELTPFESAAFDKDLDDITRFLPITPNLDEDIFSSARGDSRVFKKHPHGHKKSNKKQAEQTQNEEQIRGLSSSIPILSSESHRPIEISNIQSSDITSCTDIDHCSPVKDKKQSINKGADYKETSLLQPLRQNESELRVKSNDQSLDKLNYVFMPTSVYESPTSSGYPVTDLIDVETLSESSDATQPATENTQETERAIDVENLSDSDSDNSESTETIQNVNTEKGDECHIDVLGVSDNDSEIDDRNTNQGKRRTIRVSSSESDTDTHINITSQNTGDFKHDSRDDYIRNDRSEEKDMKKSALSNESELFENSHTNPKIYDSSNYSIGNNEENSESARCESANNSCDNLNVTHSEHSDSTEISDDDTDIDIVTLVNDKKRDDVQVYLPSDNEGNTNLAPCDNSKILPIENDFLSTSFKTNKVALSDISCKELAKSSSDITFKDGQLEDNKQRSDNVESEIKPPEDTNETIPLSATESSLTETAPETSDNHNTSGVQNDSPILTVTNTETSHDNVDQAQGGQPLSIDWTANQGFLASSRNEAGDPFASYSSSLGVGRSTLSSPSYMETLYDRRTSGFGLSPDLTFESISQSSPGQLSPVSTISDNGQDNFVPED